MGQLTNRPTDTESTPALVRADTWLDRSVRFGCAAGLALLVFASIAVYVEMGIAGILLAGCGVVLCGLGAVWRGNTFVERLLRVVNWFA